MAQLKDTSVNGTLQIPDKDNILENIVNVIYPVGSIYFSVNDINPSILFPGTQWEQFAIGKTLVGYSGGYYTTEITNSNQMIDDALTLLATGGEEKHTLTISEMPSHTHDLSRANPGDLKREYIAHTGTDAIQTGNWGVHSAGGGQAHNNCMPYIVVSIWKRIG